jgi:hypothetical protein
MSTITKYIKRYVTVLLYLVSVVLLMAQTAFVPAVAVLGFEARGLPAYEAETLTERLRSASAYLCKSNDL